MKKYVCVLSTNNYLDGVLVLNENLKQLDSKYSLLCLINENISKESIDYLELFNIEYKLIPHIEYNCENIHNWRFTFDKLNIFSLTEYEKIVYLDSDFLILNNIDNLFDMDTPTMASDYPYHTDKFNSSVMVIEPNIDDYNNLKNLLNAYKINNVKNIGDQNILNYYIKDFNKLNEKYNSMCIITNTSYPDHYKEHPVYVANPNIDDPTIIHYILRNKPFLINKPFSHPSYDTYMSYLNKVKKKKETLNNRLTIIIDNLNNNINIESCIDSINNQTYYNKDIIVLSKNNTKYEGAITINNYNELIDNTTNTSYIAYIDSNIYLDNNLYETAMHYIIYRQLDWIQLPKKTNTNIEFIHLKDKIEILTNKEITRKVTDKIFKKDILLSANNSKGILEKSNNAGILKATNNS